MKVMEGVLNLILKKISQNGINQEDSKYEKEKIKALNRQIAFCAVVSFIFIIAGYFIGYYYFSLFAISYLILFIITFSGITYHNLTFTKYAYLFTTNYCVFSISFILGYECGFYFYFFTSPLHAYIAFELSEKKTIYFSLSSFLVNALVLNILYHQGYLNGWDPVNEDMTHLFFNLNLILAFFMSVILISFFVKINNLKTAEAEELYQKQRILEAEIHLKNLEEARAYFQYQKLRDEYNQLDMFNHIISHNMRGPISTVNGLLGILREYPYSSEQQTLFKHLNTSVNMMDEVIRDLNHILVQKRMGQEALSDLTVSEIIHEVKVLLYEDIKNSQVEINEDRLSESIKSIKSILVSVFYNLISNSIKYSVPGKSPVINIRCEKSGSVMTVIFQDNGIGMDTEKNKEKIFRLYSRFHEHVNGKGIGLYLVKSHIDMLNGSIELESAPGKGATFKISLPV